MLVLLFAGIGTPGGAILSASSKPPWWVRARAVAERRFTLRAVSFSERQESLRIAAFDQFLVMINPQTGEAHGFRLPGDPALLNRKFDLVFEQQGAGTGLAIALPSWGVLYPTLSFDAARAEVSLDFHDLTEARDSTSLRGQGGLFDTRLDLIATPCRRCSWYTATSYRFEKLPSFEVVRSPRFELQGFATSRDEVRLEREVHEVSGRVGYAPPVGRITSFVGAQHRWADLEIDDRIAYHSAFSNDRLSSRTRLESETTLAVAGLDVELGSRWSGRLETAVGDGDWSAWIGLAFQPLSSGNPKERIRLRRIARDIDRLHTEFAQDVASLPQIGWLAAAQALLDRYEARLLDLLPLPEFDALQSLVRYRFDEARQLLASAATPPRASATDGVHAAYVPAWLALRAQAGAPPQDTDRGIPVISDLFNLLVRRLEALDVRVDLCVQTGSKEVPPPFTVTLLAWMYLAPDSRYRLTGPFSASTSPDATVELPKGAVKSVDVNGDRPMSRGLYGYSAKGSLANGRHLDLLCTKEEGDCVPLDLTAADLPYVSCTAVKCGVRNKKENWRGCESSPTP